MTLSADGGLDLNAIVNGGEAFVKRLSDFQAAAANYKKALDDLNLGKAARDAYDEAGRVLASAKEKRDADMAQLANDIQTAHAALTAWSDQTRTDAQAISDAATAKLAEADAKLACAVAAHASASTIISTAQGHAGDLVSDATAQAATIVGDARNAAALATADADQRLKEAGVQLTEATAQKAKYTTALDRLQGVIAATG